MSAEEWRRVPSFPMYEVSDLARIRSWRTYNRPVVPYLMTPTLARNGYFYVKLMNDQGKPCNPTLHSLIAEAFIGERPEGLVVRHIDGNPANSIPSNLVYGTTAENNLDTVDHGRHGFGSRDACSQGHTYSPENTKLERRSDGSTARRCVICLRRYQNERQERKRQARVEVAA